MTRTPVLAALAMVAIFFGAAGARVPGPAIVQVGAEYELVLPETMATAIQEAVPGFRTETLASYDADIQKYYKCTSRQAPWAVVGDFDGDGMEDLIVDGHGGKRYYRLCVWGATADVDTILGQVEGRQSGRPFNSVLMYAPPGEQGTNFSDDVIFIFVDGYVDYCFEKAGSTWYWKDRAWREFYSSD